MCMCVDAQYVVISSWGHNTPLILENSSGKVSSFGPISRNDLSTRRGPAWKASTLSAGDHTECSESMCFFRHSDYCYLYDSGEHANGVNRRRRWDAWYPLSLMIISKKRISLSCMEKLHTALTHATLVERSHMLPPSQWSDRKCGGKSVRGA